METFVASAVLAAVITSIANLIIGYKALKETRRFTSENRQLEYLKTQREELLKFLNELITFTPKTKTEDFIKAYEGDTKALDRILQDGNMRDYPSLKHIFEKYKVYFDHDIKIKLENRIIEFDEKVKDFHKFVSERALRLNTDIEISKVLDVNFLINSSTSLIELFKENIFENLEFVRKKIIKLTTENEK